MKELIQDSLLYVAKRILADEDTNPLLQIQRMYDDRTSPIVTDWHKLDQANPDRYTHLENGILIKQQMPYLRILGKFDFHVVIEIERLAATSNSSISVYVYRYPNRKHVLPCKVEYHIVDDDLERQELLVHKSGKYEVSPRDQGRCLEVRIRSKDKKLKGQCVVVYGPVSLSRVVSQRAQMLLDVNHYEEEVDGVDMKTGQPFHRLVMNSMAVSCYRMGHLGQLVLGVNMPIVSYMFSLPSQADSTVFKIVSKKDEIKIKMASTDERDLAILFVQSHIRGARKYDGMDVVHDVGIESEVRLAKQTEDDFDRQMMQNYFKPTGIGVMPKKTKREKELEKSLLMYEKDPNDEFEPAEQHEKTPKVQRLLIIEILENLWHQKSYTKYRVDRSISAKA